MMGADAIRCMKRSAAGAGGDAIPWSATDKSPDISLSGSDFVATKTVGSGNDGVGADGSSVKLTGATGEKLYAEFEILSAPANDYSGVGFAITGYSRYAALGGNNFGYGYHCNGYAYLTGGLTNIGTTYTAGDFIGVGVDLSTGGIEFYKNGILVHSATKTLLADYGHTLRMSAQSIAFSVRIITDPSQMTYPMPAGYSAWSFN